MPSLAPLLLDACARDDERPTALALRQTTSVRKRLRALFFFFFFGLLAARFDPLLLLPFGIFSCHAVALVRLAFRARRTWARWSAPPRWASWPRTAASQPRWCRWPRSRPPRRWRSRRECLARAAPWAGAKKRTRPQDLYLYIARLGVYLETELLSVYLRLVG